MHRHDAVQKYRNSTPEANPDPEVARALFFGEPPAVATVQALAQLIRGVSAGLMGLTPEDWTAVRDTENTRSLSEAVSELRATVAAVSEGDGADGTTPAGICLVATMRDALRTYRRRLQFLAINLRLSDPGGRDLLRELLAYDRWMGAHVQRCQECGGAK